LRAAFALPPSNPAFLQALLVSI